MCRDPKMAARGILKGSGVLPMSVARHGGPRISLVLLDKPIRPSIVSAFLKVRMAGERRRPPPKRRKARIVTSEPPSNGDARDVSRYDPLARSARTRQLFRWPRDETWSHFGSSVAQIPDVTRSFSSVHGAIGASGTVVTTAGGRCAPSRDRKPQSGTGEVGREECVPRTVTDVTG